MFWSPGPPRMISRGVLTGCNQISAALSAQSRLGHAEPDLQGWSSDIQFEYFVWLLVTCQQLWSGLFTSCCEGRGASGWQTRTLNPAHAEWEFRTSGLISAPYTRGYFRIWSFITSQMCVVGGERDTKPFYGQRSDLLIRMTVMLDIKHWHVQSVKRTYFNFN